MKSDVIDPDFSVSIGGWQGRITEVFEQDNLVCITWDSITLRNMPGKMIRLCEKEDLQFERMYLRPEELEFGQPRDTQQDVDEVVKSYKIK